MFGKITFAALKELLFSPVGLIVVVIVVWIASGWKHTIEARFECNARVMKLEETFKDAVEDARKFDENRLHMARVQAERDRQENTEREASIRKEIEDYAKSLEERLKNNPAANCALGSDGARAIGVRR